MVCVSTAYSSCSYRIPLFLEVLVALALAKFQSLPWLLARCCVVFVVEREMWRRWCDRETRKGSLECAPCCLLGFSDANSQKRNHVRTAQNESHVCSFIFLSLTPTHALATHLSRDNTHTALACNAFLFLCPTTTNPTGIRASADSSIPS